MLHIVNKSPTQSHHFASCLRLAQAGHSVLLIEDAVYAATRGSPAAAATVAAIATIKVYALQGDLDARGMTAALIDGVAAVDYAGFVDLVADNPTVHSWL
jgi:tRNA 2-thiouridine synthesizing protein B